MTAYIVDPAVTLYDTSGSLVGVPNNPIWVTGSTSVTQIFVTTTGSLPITGSVSISGPVTIANQVTITTTGSLPVIVTGSVGITNTLNIQGIQQTGSVATANPVLIGGTDLSGTLRTPLVDTTGVQYVTLTSPGGVNSTTGRQTSIVIPRGNLNVVLPGTTILNDKFDDDHVNTDNWSVRTLNNGIVYVNTGSMFFQTTTSSYSLAMISSHFSPAAKANAALHFSAITKVIQFASGSHFFWGFGALCNDLSSYVRDAIGFECDSSGSYNAVLYTAGTKIFNYPINNSISTNDYNTYRMFIYNNEVYYYGNSIEAPLAVARINDWSLIALPVMAHINNDGSTLSNTTLLALNSIGVADLGRNNTAISDATKPWQTAKVDEYGSQHFVPTSNDGNALTTIDGATFMRTHDEDTLHTMQSVLVELKKINVHLAMITNSQIKDTDVID
jgi:hypothetical protein